MNDTISRQAAIYALERKKDKNANGDIGGFYNKIIQNDIDALMQLPSAQPEQRWIPCEERLPEIGDTYIVTGIQKDPHEKEWHYFVDVASNYGDYIDDYWDTFNDWIEGQETHIVAWMPLPEPYKMGGDEE